MTSVSEQQYGLAAEHIEKIVELFKRHSAIEKVILYGSRAKGNFRPNSDIDLTLVGSKLSYADFMTINNELDDLLLPYTIDLSLYDRIENTALSEHIECVGLVFYSNLSA
jgi:predicted nucleotidyltransferase